MIIECRKCPSNCLTCSYGVCSTCRSGLRLLNNKCVAPCESPCKECSEDTKICTSCVNGYSLSGQICNPVTSCNAAKTCSVCPLGFILIGGQCFECDDKTNCQTCLKNNLEKCSLCQKGFYLNNFSTCTACTAEGCSECVSDSVCSQCKPGYVLSSTSSSVSTCIKCADNCASCSVTPDNCEACAPGYTLNGWNCISNFNVAIEVVFAGTVPTITT